MRGRRTGGWRGPVAALLVLALLLGVGGAQPSPDGVDGPRLHVEELRAWLRHTIGIDGEDSGGQVAAEPTAEFALPQQVPAPVGEPAPAATRVRELTSRNTETTTFYALSDGRVQAEVSAAPVRYRDGEGRLRPIDTGVVASDQPGVAFANETNTFASAFGDTTDALARFTWDGYEVAIGLPRAPVAVTPAAEGDTVTYADVFGAGADLRYQVTGGSLKEEIVLARRPAGVTYSFTLDLEGLSARRLPDGSIGFYPGDTDVAPALVMPPPFMFDSAADAASPYGVAWSPAVSQTLRRDGDRWTVVITADEAWLADPARVYPVVIDPTVKIQPTATQAQDAMVVSDDPNANFDGSWRLSVGTTTAGRARSLMRFNLSGVPDATQLDAAALEVYFDQQHTTGDVDVPLEVRRATGPWNAASVTWNAAAGLVGEQGASVVTVDDSDTGRIGVSGEWPVSGSALTQHAIRQTYRFNNNSAAGDRFTWVPALTEDGTYQVQAHYVPASDRATAAPYTVHHAGGQTTVEVDQAAGSEGEWADLGTYEFEAGTSHRVVLGDVPGRAVIADAVRFVKQGTVVRRAGESSVWHSYDVRNIAQSWLDGTQPNHGFVLKTVDEQTLGQGGPRYEAAEFAYNGESRNTPKLVLTWDVPGVELHSPERIASTGAELTWDPYTGDDLAEYQVHRSVFQSFTPSAATLVAPVRGGATSFADTTATPTAVDDPDPFGQVYYYMVVVKTTDGGLLRGPTRVARLPRAGRVVQVLQGDAADTTLTAARPESNQDVLADNPWLMAGNNSTTYGNSRAVVGFPELAEVVPAGARVLEAELGLWSTTTIGSGATYHVHALTRGFDESAATWNEADDGVPWTAAGGDHVPAVTDLVTGSTNDPAWRRWQVDGAVQGWLDDPASNHGLLVRLADEAGPAERTLFLSSEAAEPKLRPKLTVVYTEPTPQQTYFAPETPATRMIPGDDYTIPVTVSNPTETIWSALAWELSYRWELPDGTDVTNGGNQLATPLPSNIPPGGAVEVQAAVRTPIQSGAGNKRTSYVLRWELRNRLTGQWLSAVDGIGPLDQNVVVEDPTSDELGLEHFYQYAAESLGAGQIAMVNAHAGNVAVEYAPFGNPGRGLATFTRMTYNSMDTSASSMGFGWSLSGSTISRLGSPLEFHPPGQDWPTEVTLVDGDGTSHLFSLNEHGSTDPADWDYHSPAGVHLFLQRNPGADESRAWVMTKPDRTQFFFDEDGYPSAVVDRNGNTQTFTYEERRSQNRPTKFLQYVTDPTGRQTLRLEYYERGQEYAFIDDEGNRVEDDRLTNPHIIDQVRSITDVSGRRVALTYTDKGLMAELVDGAGTGLAKTFRYEYDALQGNRNVKLVAVTDPRGNSTALAYYNPPPEPKFHWWARSVTSRVGGVSTFAYVDPDGQAGSTIRTTVTDPEVHATVHLTDGFGRPTQVTDALGEVTTLTWDADNNVVELVEPNGAVNTWTYDPLTGYPLTIRDPEANANGTPATALTYQTGLGGRIADLVGETSPEGRAWAFAYDPVGNLVAVTDPIGTTTSAPDDFTTRYTYDAFGQLLATIDANGNQTTNSDYHPTGSPETITDALGNTVEAVYDERGNATEATDQLGKTSTTSYDVFGRPLETVQPLDQDEGEFITTPAPVYDRNDNVVVSTAPNGAATSVVFDEADRPVRTTLPENMPDGPARVMTMTYDEVGNVLSETEPKGNLTPGDPDDFVTRYVYDAANQLSSVTDAENNQTTYAYDDVGNLVLQTDPRGNSTSFAFDLNGRLVQQTDPAAETVTNEYDLDGLATATVDQLGVRTETVYDARGMVAEVRAPHTSGVTRTTRYEYDQVGNTVMVTSPRGVATTDDPDDFAQQTVYDELNRPVEQILPFDRDDPVHDTPASILYEYDAASRVTTVSAPPSQGQSVRNETVTEYLDTGWIEATTDPLGIQTSYTYNLVGLQTGRTLTSAGGSSGRTMTWDYFLDGSLAARSDDGVPVGLHVVLVDNSDVQNVTVEGDWSTVDTAEGLFGFDYATHPAGTGQDSVTWRLNIPADGSYEVFARWPEVSGAASDAPYSIVHDGGDTTVTVDQSQRAGEWVSLGSHAFVEGNQGSVALSDSAGGTVVADAVKLVRDTTGETDTEAKDFTYAYDANGSQVEITDNSSGALVDSYQISYDGLNRLSQVDELMSGVVANTTGYTYDPNGNLLTRTHDLQDSTFAYDARNLLTEATVVEPGVAPKVTTFTFTPRGQRATQTSGNGNTIEYGYHLDGSLHTQTETQPGGTLVASHEVDYDLNGNRSRDAVQVQNADDPAAYLEHAYTYTYDPRDRLAQLTKTVAGGASTTESYLHDANSNVVSATVDGVTTTSTYDRNRLQATTSAGVTTSYNYDPFGRLDTVSAAGELVQQYRYDGFDHISEQRTRGPDPSTTRYAYDPLDRTAQRTDDAGSAESETTSFAYLGTSGEVAAEFIDGTLDRSYQYGPGGQRLSMQTHDASGAPQESSYYSYNPHADVVAITDEAGDTRATYGYTAYGQPDLDLFTGVDAPDPADPDAEPYNIYRFNAMRVDAASGNYDMGFRNYSPGEGRFLSPDMYNGALANLGLTTSAWTGNRYAFGAGNPISAIENDGHCWGFLEGACEAVGGAVSDAWSATTDWWSDTAQPWLEENIVDPVQDVAEATTDAVSDAWEATTDFVEEHKAEIAGIVAGIVVTGGCLIVTGGAGSIGCAALGGAVGAGITGYMNGQRGWDLVGSIALGAAAGAVGGAVGSLIGRGVGVLASRLGSAVAANTARTQAGVAAAALRAQGGRLPTATAAAVDRTTGRIFTGHSGEGLQVPGSLSSRLPNPSLEPWSAANCAEVAACTRAITAGANLDDLVVYTVRTRTGEHFPPCANCRVWLPR